MNTKILNWKPELTKKVKLIIEPLAPLSMVSDIPGTYYKAEDVPNKYKICGLFENILGWHFSKIDRVSLVKEKKELYKKKFKIKDFKPDQAKSGYSPLLMEYFDIGMVYKNEAVVYNDLWKKSFSRTDAEVHPNGTPNLDYNTLKQKPLFLKKGTLLEFYQNNIKEYPLYYTSPKLREYYDYGLGEIQILITIDPHLLEALNKSLLAKSSAYLGNSEGWVEIKIEEL